MFCQRLKKLRESHNFNKKQMSKILGLPYTTYNNYETGAREPSSDVLIKISTTFNVTIDYLLGVLPEKEPAIVFELTENDKIIIKKYHQLDLRGQQAVEDTLNRELKYILDDNKQLNMSEIASDAIQTIDKISENMFKNQNDSVRKK